jgi:predicted alpha/beta hydrolase family esterase
MGCQTILRYIESLQKDEKVGGAVLVAGFTHLTDEAYEDEEDPLIAKPWLETKINWKTILKHTKKFTAIFSDNDPYVPLTDTKIFKKNLGAKIIIEHDKKHFSGDDGITELPVTLDELLKMAKK